MTSFIDVPFIGIRHMNTPCTHANLNFQYRNVAGNDVSNYADCKILIIKKPSDPQLYTLDGNLQLTPAN